MAKVHIQAFYRVAGIAYCGMARYGAENILEPEAFHSARASEKCAHCVNALNRFNRVEPRRILLSRLALVS